MTLVRRDHRTPRKDRMSNRWPRWPWLQGQLAAIYHLTETTVVGESAALMHTCLNKLTLGRVEAHFESRHGVRPLAQCRWALTRGNGSKCKAGELKLEDIAEDQSYTCQFNPRGSPVVFDARTVQLQTASWLELAEAKARAQLRARNVFGTVLFVEYPSAMCEVDEGDRGKVTRPQNAYRARATQDSPQAWAQPLVPPSDNESTPKATNGREVRVGEGWRELLLEGGWTISGHSGRKIGRETCSARKWSCGKHLRSWNVLR